MKNKHRIQAAESNNLNKSILVDGKLPSEGRAIYESSFAASQEAAAPKVEKIRASRRISKDGLAIRINARDKSHI